EFLNLTLNHLTLNTVFQAVDRSGGLHYSGLSVIARILSASERTSHETIIPTHNIIRYPWMLAPNGFRADGKPQKDQPALSELL
ncbi:MAG: hypothetical protein PVG41_15600, partial [Desulfobacteraceae bacterium]